MKNIWSPAQEINKATADVQNWSTSKILSYSTDELLKIHRAVRKTLPTCEQAVETIVECVKVGGRVITIGAGGSGVAGMSVMRELPQNHEALTPDKFVYRVAGGSRIFNPLGCEELEDDSEEGKREIETLSVNNKDVVILISATGRTPYTRSAAIRAKELGSCTIGLICYRSELLQDVQIPILLDVGPEMFVGATCEMAATAQKHTLDMIMNGVVVRLGVTSGNICHARLVHDKARKRQNFFTSA